MDPIIAIKYREFFRSDAYSLFEFILNTEKQDIIELMISENDKDKLYILKKQIDALSNLKTSIQTKVTEEQQPLDN